MSKPIGWLVRVSGQPVWDGVYDTIVYLAGYASPEEAKAAVMAKCNVSDELAIVLPDAIVPGRGPQPMPGEVRLLTGVA